MSLARREAPSRRRASRGSGGRALVFAALLLAPVAAGCPPPPRPAPLPPGAETASDSPGRGERGIEPSDARPIGDPPPAPAPPPGEPAEPEPAPVTSEGVAAILSAARATGVVKAFPHLRVFLREKRIEVDGLTSLKVGPQLELLACSPRGKAYESLLLWLCEPEQLQLALLFLGLEPTPQIHQFGEQGALARGQRVVIEVEWKDVRTGRVVRRRAEDLLYDVSRDGCMKHAGWVFTGSRFVDVPQPPDWNATKKVYAASATGTIAVTYHDPDAILDTPLAEGGNNTLFVAWSERLPERHTEIVCHLRPFVVGEDDREPADARRAPGTERPPGGGAPGGGGMGPEGPPPGGGSSPANGVNPETPPPPAPGR